MDELQARREPRPELLAHLGAQHAGCRLERRGRIGELLLIPVHGVEDARVLKVSGHPHIGDGHETEPRIAQTLLEPARDDLLDAF